MRGYGRIYLSFNGYLRRAARVQENVQAQNLVVLRNDAQYTAAFHVSLDKAICRSPFDATMDNS